MGTEDEWTAADLVEEARSRGFTKVSRRLVVDWTEVGLLDSPIRRPLPKGGSEPAVWSNHQAELFFALLDKRRTANRVATLCNIPVFVWLGWGETFVPIRQVRRAMRTYSERYKTGSGRAAAFTAKETFRILGVTKPTPRQRDLLVNALTDLTAQPHSEVGDLESHLADALETAIAPHGTRLDLPTVTNLIWATNCRLAAAAAFRDDTDADALPDQVFQSAQFLYRQSAPDYLQHGYSTAGPDTRWARLEELANNACSNLLFELGRNLTTPLPPASPAALRDQT